MAHRRRNRPTLGTESGAVVVETLADLGGRAQAALAELAGIMLADHTLESVMNAVADLAKRVVPGADEASVTLMEDGRATTIAFTGALAVDLDERQYSVGHGPCLDGTAAGSMVVVDDVGTDGRWADWAAFAARRGAGSAMAIPVPLQREVAAALNIYSTRAHAFDKQSRDLAAEFAAYAGVSLANMHLYEAQAAVAAQLQTAMASRAVIEQAKGILMGARRCTAEQAFDLLVDLSQGTNRKLREVAEALVADAVIRVG